MSDKIPIHIAYSPDTDDAFMMWALREHRIDWGPFVFQFTTDDIQVLNQKAQDGIYEITAISVAAFPLISGHYIMMPIGGSVARRMGPAVIINSASPLKSIQDLLGKSVAVPGLQTSAALAASVLLPRFTPVPMPFDRIAAAVTTGAVDAGILIHELQLDPQASGFHVLGHLGDLWKDKYGLPLPLGTNAIKRTLGPECIAALTDLLRQSVEYGLTNRKEAIEFARLRAQTLSNTEEAGRYIEQFVNADSLAIQTDLKQAIEQMFRDGTNKKLWQAAPEEPLFCS